MKPLKVDSPSMFEFQIVPNKGTLKSPAEEHLQRELSLMQSAWYNLSSRLESDAVTIQRRSEAPKSFLNRQRQLVNNPAFVK